MVLILYKQIISYDRTKLKKVGDFYVLTWLIFAGPVTNDDLYIALYTLGDAYYVYIGIKDNQKIFYNVANN